jgi:hypothetical protein
MDIYKLTQFFLQWASFLITLIGFILLYKKGFKIRAPIMFIIGWFALVVFANLYWSFSIAYAPTEELRQYYAAKDGGPRVGSIFFGWVYILVFLLFFEVASKITIFASRLVKGKHNKPIKQD